MPKYFGSMLKSISGKTSIAQEFPEMLKDFMK
jgi:hypothetical protein